MILTANANAKINLFLKICGILPQGYHRLYMLMQEIALADQISIEFKSESDSPIIEIESEADCPPEKDLCYKAANLFYQEYKNTENATKRLCDIKISEVKNTPSQAGLGGGSSDAATVLKLLQQYYNQPFTHEKLIQMATSLGADVPFFLVGGSCFCEGIGEIITPLPSLAGLPMILVKPNEGVPTGPCFKLSDSKNMPFDEEKYIKQMNEIFNNDNLSAVDKIKHASKIMVNDLQEPAIELVPVINELLNELNKTNPVFSLMSGSGSSVYAIYDSVKSRDEAMENLTGEIFKDCFILGCQTQ